MSSSVAPAAIVSLSPALPPAKEDSLGSSALLLPALNPPMAGRVHG